MPTRITLKRFDALGGWCRKAGTRNAYPIAAAFSTSDEAILAATYYDRSVDKGLGGAGLFRYVLLSRDAFGRYQVFDHVGPYATARASNKAATLRLLNLEGKPAPQAPMLPNSPPGVDLFSLVADANTINPKFLNMRDSQAASAARELLAEISRWFVDRDGNFVKDFQSTGYDSRIWELYLFATFTAMDFEIGSEYAVPDFCLSRNGKTVFVEATTVNPTGNVQPDITGAPPLPPENLREYIEREMALKFGSPLESKVKKTYWELPHVKDHPFMIAIADFHLPGSMVWSQAALPSYLYGQGVEEYQIEGNTRWRDKSIATHEVGKKVIASNFFGQVRHKHVSAILSSNAGTQAKFNRMGVLADFGDDAVQLVRCGGWHVPGDDAYDPEPFRVNVEAPDYSEDWNDEVQVFHNPNAVHPIAHDMFPTAANYWMVDGVLVWNSPKRPVLFSSTRASPLPFSGPEDIEKLRTAASRKQRTT